MWKAGQGLSVILGFLELGLMAQSSLGNPTDSAVWEVPVLVVSFFPTNGAFIDQTVTGDWGATIEETRAKTRRLTQDVIAALENGSRYRGYTNPASLPSLKYRLAGQIEFLRPLPTFAKKDHQTPMTDYFRIMADIHIRDWVEQRGIREVWIWAYHGGKVDLWESNMASPFGDVSNSDRDPDDLPVLAHTYTVYHYNYQRGASEAVENHIHQIEAVLNHIDGRDATPAEKWNELLFWGRFVGSDQSHKIVRPGCGWAHYPPNAERDYDWDNPREVLTDMEDWKPDGTGRKHSLNARRWNGDSLSWFIYWMQNLPGKDNTLTYQGRRLRNWWVFMGDYDNARRQHWKLTE
ncbi:MAG TPA: hypothetical protein P5186_29095 [Candidatus Paceibacterota bacterium]|nr:hypothetical protein [Candidatus Paceibacterota bacterium]